MEAYMKIGHNGFSDTKESKMLENISKCSHNVNSTEYLYSVYWAVIMGCLLLLFLSYKTNTWANINPKCKINRFDTSVEKKMQVFKVLSFVVVVVLFSFFVIFEGNHRTPYNRFIKVTERWLMCLCPI